MRIRVLLLSKRVKPSDVNSCLRSLNCELEIQAPAQAEQICQYDIVITDVLGGEDHKAIGEMKRACPWLLVLALLTFGDENAERKAMEGGVDDMLCLPVSNARLRLTLLNLMRVRILERVMWATKRLAAA